MIEVNDSDSDYYQNAVVQLYNVTETQNINNPCRIWINDTLQFDGYVSSRQQSIDKGKKVWTYQMLGRTRDLWKYHTDNNVTYSGNTGYIVSSLISTYCDGVTANLTSPWVGTSITEDIDLSNMIVGDAIVRLTEMDGYNFYINTDGALQYYHQSERDWGFSIEESDIVEMDSIEDSDEDLINDVVVIGSTSDYTKKTSISPSHPNSTIIPSGIFVAQRFTAEDSRLSAVKLYLDRTVDPNQPEELIFDIWEDSAKTLFTDTFDNYDYLNTSTGWNMIVSNGYLQLDYDSNSLQSQTNSTGNDKHSKGFAQTFKAVNTKDGTDVVPISGCFKITTDEFVGDSMIGIISIRPTGSDGAPEANDSNDLCSGLCTIYEGTNQVYDVNFLPKTFLTSGNKYAMVFRYKYNEGLAYADKLDVTAIGKGFGNPYESGKYYTWQYGDEYDTTDALDDAYFKIRLVNYCTSGMIQTPSYIEECMYMKLDIDGVVSSNNIGLSGTATEQTWVKLTDDTWHDYDYNTGTSPLVRYYMNSDGTFTPKIDTATLYIGDAAGSSQGYPESGNSLEYADTLSWYHRDIPYPPSYNSWKSYSDPLLRLIEDRSYWLILSNMSSNSAYWTYFYNPDSDYDGEIMYSNDEGVTWSSNSDGTITIGSNEHSIPAGNMTFKLGWSESTEGIRATAVNSDSINLYGRHTKIINDSNATTLEQAQARADAEVSGMNKLSKKGTLTINGRADMSVEYKFSSSLVNFDIDDVWDVISYTQTIDNNGFRTTINYGKQPFDFIRNLANLEHDYYGGNK